MDKMLKKVLVIKNDVLFGENERFQGFSDNISFLNLIKEKHEFMIRGEAEVNFQYKQPITYAAVLESSTNKLFVYKRGGASSNAGESRLFNKISFGIGGHIDDCDKDNCGINILEYSLKREIEEELAILESDIVDVKIAGFINDDSNEVNSVHIGVFFIVTVNTSKVIFNDGELANGEFYAIEEVEKMMKSGEYDVETWSQIIFEPLKKIMS